MTELVEARVQDTTTSVGGRKTIVNIDFEEEGEERESAMLV